MRTNCCKVLYSLRNGTLLSTNDTIGVFTSPLAMNETNKIYLGISIKSLIEFINILQTTRHITNIIYSNDAQYIFNPLPDVRLINKQFHCSSTPTDIQESSSLEVNMPIYW